MNIVGYFLEAFIFQIGIANELIGRILLLIFPTAYLSILIVVFGKNFNKWNWVSYAAVLALSIAIIFSIFGIVRLFAGVEETFFDIIYTVAGFSWAPACLTFYLIYKFHRYITDYGGIHLFLRWIYRISETHCDLKSLHLSFEKLMLELDSWLNNTLKLVIKNRIEILKAFSLNIIFFYGFLTFVTKVAVPRPLREVNEPLGSIQSSYTPTELRKLFSAISIEDYSIKPTLAWMYIQIKKSS